MNTRQRRVIRLTTPDRGHSCPQRLSNFTARSKRPPTSEVAAERNVRDAGASGPRRAGGGDPAFAVKRRLFVLLLAGLALTAVILAGCTTPIGADHTTFRRGYAQVNASALQGDLSDISVLVLYRYGLEATFEEDPAAALTNLHAKACGDSRRDVLLALADLNYYHAECVRRSVKPGANRAAPDFYLSSALYAWLYLFGESNEPLPAAFDRRARIACDLYSHALARAFAPVDGTNTVLVLENGRRQTGAGWVHVRFSQPSFEWDLDEVKRFLPADEYRVRGLSVRDRQEGVGTPLIVVLKGEKGRGVVRNVPGTLLLRTTGGMNDWSRGNLEVSLELHSAFQQKTIELGGHEVSLQSDLTAPLAHSLNDSQVWKLGSRQFFSSEERIRSDIYETQPYVPGKIPVVFVHGTFSSPVWWAEMWNSLRADPLLREHYQFWNFIYNSGNPMTYSAAHLRDRIRGKAQQFDPDGRDPAMTNMVVIGHSQGGLLAKLTVTETGDQLWNAVSKKPFSAVEFDNEEDRQAVRRNFFFSPVPNVQRVVFIATPHRGSFLARSFIRDVSRRFMSFPRSVLSVTSTLLKLQGKEPVPSEVRKTVITSLDQMSPKDPLLNALADIPAARGVRCHSVIGVRGDKEPPEGGDGVVKYVSAHVEYADSELVVRRSHSCQDKPEVIEEVRRILIQHLEPRGRVP